MRKLAIAILSAGAALGQSWVAQTSGVAASLRGVSAVSSTVAWVSGEKGVYLKTADGGTTWGAGVVPGAADLDFRGVYAIDDRKAYLLSSGPGEKSRIYKTADGGIRWTLLFTNPDPKGFFDGMTFWDDAHGVVVGDPVDGRFAVLTTADGGMTWHRQKTPPASPNEGAFAASNSCVFVRGAHEVWFATGGPGGGRVFHSTDGGQTWAVSKTGIRSDSASAGVFSLAFSNAREGIAVGGDYMKAADGEATLALTGDGGKTWIVPNAPGFRSAVAYLADRKQWIATGPAGSDVSQDDGKTWKRFDTSSFNAVSFARDGSGWAVGPKGAIGRFKAE